MRVAGCDPGTSSLDVVVLDDGEVSEQVRFTPEQMREMTVVADLAQAQMRVVLYLAGREVLKPKLHSEYGPSYIPEQQ